MKVSLAPCLSFAAFCLLYRRALADECQPYTWALRTIKVGSIQCRYETTTGSQVDSQTCDSIAQRYLTTVDSLVDLNPELDHTCQSIMPDTTYCVKGFHEPLRAYDGLCGPEHENATCSGTSKQCCNSNTWKCGDTEDDCKVNCYEGACLDP